MTSSSSSSPSYIQLLRIRECFGYQIHRKTGEHYFCESWGLDKPLFTGELQLLSNNHILIIRLINKENSEIFADSAELNCITINKPTPLLSFIEPVKDSSRYFVIKIRDPGSKRVLPFGIGFRERNYSFDLRAAIDDKIKSVQRYEGNELDSFNANDNNNSTKDLSTRLNELKLRELKESELAEKRLLDGPKLDFSIKPGERIKIHMKSTKLSNDHDNEEENHSDNEENDDNYKIKNNKNSSAIKKSSIPIIPLIGGKLLPPPAAATVVEVHQSKKSSNSSIPAVAVTSAAVVADDDEWGDFSSAT